MTDVPMREYESDGIVVEWRPTLCFHSRNCVAALPAVFDPERRPWIDARSASADAVEAAVARCPSGALRFRRLGAPGPVPALVEPLAITEVTAMAGGPLLLRGALRILDADGNLLAETDRAALCRCGQSKNKPFCDGTHKEIGFTG
jgi:uncharacterized Fe-S cluster protein YjdI